MQPSFIGIGFQRCGTSWLNEMLNAHPQIGKPPSGLHFFNRSFALGSEWYEGQLGTYASQSTTVVGEFSTTYSYPEYATNVAERIHALYPNVKLIASLRAPADRAYSDFLRGQLRGEIREEAFGAALRSHPCLVSRGRYVEVLSAFTALFLGENVHYIRFDEIQRDPRSVVRHLYRFLGVDETYVPRGISSPTNSTKGGLAALKGLAWSSGFAAPLRRIPGVRTGARWLRHGLSRGSTKIQAQGRVPEADVSDYLRLRAEYESSLEATMELTGLDLTDWAVA